MATHKQEHRPVDDVSQDLNEVPPEGIEPDLTPAPGTQRGIPDAEPTRTQHEAPASAPSPAPGFSQSQGQGESQSQSQSQGPGQTQSQTQKDLGFDPDSPDVADPQVDPVGPAQIPDDAPGMQVKKRVNDDEYPPYNKP
jgi:hypothetical protein